jgi:hypothetical protein
MFLQDLGQFFGEWDGAFFLIFRQKRILRFCPDADAPVRQVKHPDSSFPPDCSRQSNPEPVGSARYKFSHGKERRSEHK